MRLSFLRSCLQYHISYQYNFPIDLDPPMITIFNTGDEGKVFNSPLQDDISYVFEAYNMRFVCMMARN